MLDLDNHKTPDLLETVDLFLLGNSAVLEPHSISLISRDRLRELCRYVPLHCLSLDRLLLCLDLDHFLHFAFGFVFFARLDDPWLSVLLSLVVELRLDSNFRLGSLEISFVLLIAKILH